MIRGHQIPGSLAIFETPNSDKVVQRAEAVLLGSGDEGRLWEGDFRTLLGFKGSGFRIIGFRV